MGDNLIGRRMKTFRKLATMAPMQVASRSSSVTQQTPHLMARSQLKLCVRTEYVNQTLLARPCFARQQAVHTR